MSLTIPNTQENVQTAFDLHKAGRYADAARIYQGLLDGNSENATVLHLFGVMHQQCGYSARAAELIGRAIELRPGVAEYHANLSEVQRTLKQHEQAAVSCRLALRLRPEYPEALNNLGLALHELGKNEEAVAQYDAALALRPNFALALNNRASALRALGKTSEAVESYRAAICAEPTLARAHANLGQLLADQGHLVEGLDHCREAVRLQSDLPAAHNNLGNVLRTLERWTEAADAYANAIRLQPDLAIAHTNLGLSFQCQANLGAALPHFRRATELSPDDAGVWQQLANVQGLLGDWEAAIASCQRRRELKPEDSDAYNDLGWAYQSNGCHAEAEAAYCQALEFRPDHLDALLNIGSLHEELGAMAKAEACYREAERLHPHAPLPLARRAMLMRSRFADVDRARLCGALRSDCSSLARMNVLFALAQVADSRGEYADAAAALEEANSLARELRSSRGQTYDANEHSGYVDRLIAAFTPAFFERLASAGDDTMEPVFVFGLPRSGTTLVEQILASHSHVFGAGELSLAYKAMNTLPPVADRPEDLSACLQTLDAASIRQLAQGYRDGVQKLLHRQEQQAGKQESRNGSTLAPLRVVDKMPDNYLWLGLIALMFPRATLIHVRRDLRDTAVSCWMTHFSSIRWADDKNDLVQRLLDYRRLAAHWSAVLARPVHEVFYERLMGDFETESRRLVAACGLDWEPACLRFHETARPVRTASVIQVRQPLHMRSVARWRNYVEALAPIFGQLDVLPSYHPTVPSS